MNKKFEKNYEKSTLSRDNYLRCNENKSSPIQKIKNTFKYHNLDMSHKFNKRKYDIPLKKIKFKVNETKLILEESRKKFKYLFNDFYSKLDCYLLTN